MPEKENFEGKPNLKEFEFSHCGHQFKVSNWYDLKVVEGAAKVEQDGLLLSFDDRMAHDMRKPFLISQSQSIKKSSSLKFSFLASCRPRFNVESMGPLCTALKKFPLMSLYWVRLISMDRGWLKGRPKRRRARIRSKAGLTSLVARCDWSLYFWLAFSEQVGS